MAEGVDVTVKPEIREVVEAAARLLRPGEGRCVRSISRQRCPSASRLFRGALLVPSTAGFSKTSRSEKDARQGSFSEIRCRLILRSFQLLTD